VRGQEFVGGLADRKALVPHHIRDPRARPLADQIIEAQVREIRDMRVLIAALEREPVAADAPGLPPRSILPEAPQPQSATAAATARAAPPRGS